MRPYPLYATRDVETVKDLFTYPIEHTPEKDAFRVRTGKDSYEGVSWKRFRDDVEALGTALYARGLRGAHLGIMGENVYEWVLAYMTALCGNMVAVPLDKDLPPDRIAELAEFADCQAFFFSRRYGEAGRRVSRALGGPGLVVALNGGSEFPSLESLLEEGRKLLSQGDRSYADDSPEPDRLAAVYFTSGTGGKQKGVMLSQENIVSSFDGACRNLSFTEDDVMLSVLPLHHAYETNCGVLAMLHTSTVVCFNENLKLLTSNMKLFRPTGMSVVPLILDTLYRQIREGARKSGKLRKLEIGQKLNGFLNRIGLDASDKLFGEVYEAVGGRLKKGFVGGAAMNPETTKGLKRLGIRFQQGYGITECSPLVSVNRERHFKDASVGLPTPACEVRAREGEIQVRGRNVMMGYYKDPEATKEAFTEDGWFRTGDLGRIDEDGFVFITGRKKNLIILESGENISPEELEGAFSGEELVSEIVVNDDDGVITAHIFPDAEYAKARNITDVREALEEIVARINAANPRYKHIAQIKIRDREFEKTTTKKILRHKVGKD